MLQLTFRVELYQIYLRDGTLCEVKNDGIICQFVRGVA